MRAFPQRLVVVAGYIVAALVFTWPLPLHLSTHLTGDPGGDTGVYVWNQWVFHQELIEGHNPLSTGRILALTDRVDLTQHNYTAFLNLLALPLISPLGVVAAFNIVFLIACVLNGVTMYGLARRVTSATRIEAWLAGLCFAWSPVMLARTTGHYSLAAAAALPAFMWCLSNAERSRSARDAALVGLCMAWAALSDAYFGIYCVMIALLYMGALVVRIRRGERTTSSAWIWPLDVAIVCLGGLIAGLSFGPGGEFTVFGIPVRMRSLYNPVLALTVMVMLRIALRWRPRISLSIRALGPIPVKAVLIAFAACVGPLVPVLYGLTARVNEGRFVSPKIFWRSSPPGVDLLSFLTPNPLHPISKWLLGDPLAAAPTIYVEYTASMSLVALVVIALAMWRARYRPSAGWLVITIGFALLAMGPFIHVGGLNTHVPGPWALFRYLPGIGLARMPTRFALVASMGIAVLMAGAMAALGERWPTHRRRIVAIAGVLLVCELWVAPRTLYSAAIPSVYDRIAADPRPVRLLSLPVGVRDGTWETGNFRPRSLYHQTRHGKAMIGGYLSRVSPKRVERMRREFPTLDALIALSEPRGVGVDVAETLRAGADRLIQQANVGYVIIDSRFISPERAQMVIDAFHLREVQRDGPLVLYVPASNP